MDIEHNTIKTLNVEYQEGSLVREVSVSPSGYLSLSLETIELEASGISPHDIRPSSVIRVRLGDYVGSVEFYANQVEIRDKLGKPTKYGERLDLIRKNNDEKVLAIWLPGEGEDYWHVWEQEHVFELTHERLERLALEGTYWVQ